MITVRHILSMPAFNGFEIIAGEDGLKRSVSSVSVMDAPDIHNWLKGGEILLTTGYIMRDNPLEIANLIKNINKAGAAALFIKLKRFIDILPQEIIDLANRLDFPLVSLPINCAFTDVINPALSYIINEQTKKLQHSEKIHKSFTQLVINGGDTQQIIDTLSDILHRDTAFYDTYFKKIFLSCKNKDFEDFLKDTSLNKILEQYPHFSIKIDNVTYGYIVLQDSGTYNFMKDFDEIAVEHASTVLKLDIQKKISNQQIEYKYRHEFIQDLILNNIKSLEEVNFRANLYGWSFDEGIITLIVDIDNFKAQYLNIKSNYTLEKMRDNIFDISKSLITKHFSQTIYGELSDSIVFLLKPNGHSEEAFTASVRKVCENIRISTLEKTKFTVTIGVGGYKASVMDTYISYQEAQKAVKFGRILYNINRTVFYSELRIYRFLESIYSTKESKEFCKFTLGKLKEHDLKYHSDLLGTLHCIDQNNWNLKAASEEMFIHYNTIKYRYKKICELLGSDLNYYEERLQISLALKLIQMEN